MKAEYLTCLHLRSPSLEQDWAHMGASLCKDHSQTRVSKDLLWVPRRTHRCGARTSHPTEGSLLSSAANSPVLCIFECVQASLGDRGASLVADVISVLHPADKTPSGRNKPKANTSTAPNAGQCGSPAPPPHPGHCGPHSQPTPCLRHEQQEGSPRPGPRSSSTQLCLYATADEVSSGRSDVHISVRPWLCHYFSTAGPPWTVSNGPGNTASSFWIHSIEQGLGS